jgi:hypothetical protein
MCSKWGHVFPPHVQLPLQFSSRCGALYISLALFPVWGMPQSLRMNQTQERELGERSHCCSYVNNSAKNYFFKSFWKFLENYGMKHYDQTQISPHTLQPRTYLPASAITREGADKSPTWQRKQLPSLREPGLSVRQRRPSPPQPAAVQLPRCLAPSVALSPPAKMVE